MFNRAKIQSLLLDMEKIALHPQQAVKEWLAQTGGKAVGCLPVHSIGAEELIYAAGMLPVGMWGGQTSISMSGQYVQTFCCSVMKGVMELSMKGAYDILSAVISPNTCDTMRCIPLLLRIEKPGIPVIGLVLPDNRKIDAGMDYLEDEFRQVAGELEKISGAKITDAKLKDAILLYNQHRDAVNEFYDLVPDHLDIITPYFRHIVIKSSYFIPRDKHLELLNQLNDLLKQEPKAEFTGKKVVVTGIMAEPLELLNILEELNMAVVADETAHGSRQFRTKPGEEGDPYHCLAERFKYFEGCATVYDPKKQRGLLIRDMVKKYGASGVIVFIMKFCDPEEYDYPFIKADLDEAGISSLYVEIEQQMDSMEQIRTRLQAYSEMLI